MRHDIESIIDGVRRLIPEVEVVQMHKIHAADDDGLWWFRLPGRRRDIQIESWTYDCPFLIEHDDMKSSSDALTGHSVSETVQIVTKYLLALREDKAEPLLSPIPSSDKSSP